MGTPEPVVAGFYQWGPWVNGGAWLTIGGQRVDFLYRSLEHVERTIADAEAGRYELHHAQHHPGPAPGGRLTASGSDGAATARSDLESHNAVRPVAT